MREPRLPFHRSPTPPGEMLLEEFLRPWGETPRAMERRAGLPRGVLARLISRRTVVTPELAAGLSRATGMSPGFWLTLQWGVDHWLARHS